ncbi:GNAT family N-acetyltransferase [Undibacterium terreum]|uniref:N-acetyltransferase n=1 Tax=Undibacterium terreum TaxID=1224302 RepID=A0A916UN58_9BURK|nr:GNAT family N-acetyltransferase [Undibacterium terreum]GGC79366.1 N-acetyltransferase [Undibacterium terreum]
MLEIINADLNNPQHGAAFIALLNDYARDPMGGGEELPDYAKANLVSEVRKRSNIRVVLAFVDGQPAGFSTCIDGFSTFACKPLLNIHDIAVNQQFRGLGIAKKLLSHIEDMARESGCCKITLEVLQGNVPAASLYKSLGFATYELDPAMGGASLMQKKL